MEEQQVVEESRQIEIEPVLAEIEHMASEPRLSQLTPAERSELEYQRALSKFPPGSPLFRALVRSRRSVRVFKHHAMYWPTGRELTESGNASRARRG
jgi:hypothetical protein